MDSLQPSGLPKLLGSPKGEIQEEPAVLDKQARILTSYETKICDECEFKHLDKILDIVKKVHRYSPQESLAAISKCKYSNNSLRSNRLGKVGRGKQKFEANQRFLLQRIWVPLEADQVPPQSHL